MRWLIGLVVAVAVVSTGLAVYQQVHPNYTMTVTVIQPSGSPSANLLPTPTGLPSYDTQVVKPIG